MRDIVRSDDDIAIEVAKTKLVALASRPGYREAMSPEPGGSRTARAILYALAAGLLALAIVTFQNIEAAWLSWLLLILLIILSLACAIGAWASAPTPAPRAIAAVITARLPDNTLKLLGEDGIDLTVWTRDDIYASVRVGDVGVAHVEPNDYVSVPDENGVWQPGPREWVVEFRRL